MQTPKSVKIGAQLFEIVEHERKKDATLHDGNYGYTIDEHNIIVIDANIHMTKKQVTLLHEIMHAARMVFEGPVKPADGASADDWEHHFIGVWETSLLMVLRDNPEIVKWLTK
jgi:hypothetical protein